jgi:hypothetical protein
VRGCNGAIGSPPLALTKNGVTRHDYPLYTFVLQFLSTVEIDRLQISKTFTGQKFGRLTAIVFSHTAGGAIWPFRCDCGIGKTRGQRPCFYTSHFGHAHMPRMVSSCAELLFSLNCWMQTKVSCMFLSWWRGRPLSWLHFLRASTILARDLVAVCRILPIEARSP